MKKERNLKENQINFIINLNVYDFNKQYLNYIAIQLFNRIVHSFWKSLTLLFAPKYYQRNLIIFARCWIFQKL
jgi:hypothetical protein